MIYISQHQGSRKEEALIFFTESVFNLHLQYESLFLLGDFNLYEFSEELNTRSVMISQYSVNINLLESLITVKNKNNKTLDLCSTYTSEFFQNKNKRHLDVNKMGGLVKEDVQHPAIEKAIS